MAYLLVYSILRAKFLGKDWNSPSSGQKTLLGHLLLTACLIGPFQYPAFSSRILCEKMVRGDSNGNSQDIDIVLRMSRIILI